MPPLRVCLTCLSLLGGGIASTSSARAHINLIVPEPRVPGRPDSALSRGPCGQTEDRRLPENLSVFQPGQTIEVIAEVYVQHVSYFRISFDADGDDSFSARPTLPADPAADDPTLLPADDGETILAIIEDHTGNIDRIEQQVTLPNVLCDNCTLQLIQFTYGLPLDRATYHQCADLVLEGPPAAPRDEPAPGAAASAVDPDADGQSGCSLRTSRTGVARRAMPWLWLWLAIALRRQRGRQRFDRQVVPLPASPERSHDAV
jgi:hypothetical protein